MSVEGGVWSVEFKSALRAIERQRDAHIAPQIKSYRRKPTPQLHTPNSTLFQISITVYSYAFTIFVFPLSAFLGMFMP